MFEEILLEFKNEYEKKQKIEKVKIVGSEGVYGNKKLKFIVFDKKGKQLTLFLILYKEKMFPIEMWTISEDYILENLQEMKKIINQEIENRIKFYRLF